MISERAHTLIFAVLWGAAAVFGTMLLVSAVRAHDRHHPELGDWFRSLANSHGVPGCDGSDATRTEDVDWQTICETDTGECHYQVAENTRLTSAQNYSIGKFRSLLILR